MIADRLRRCMKTEAFGAFQNRGVRFVERAKGRALIADDMGLGKTWQAIAWNALHRRKRKLRGHGTPTVAVVCPASIKYKWQREWRQHAGLRSHVLDGAVVTEEEAKLRLKKRIRKIKRKRAKLGPRVVAQKIRDTKKRYRLGRKKQAKKIAALKEQKILIVNYEILEGWLPVLLSLGIEVLVIDECHYVKNPSAKRTKACKALSKKAKHVIGLSGTPIAGKPIEFFPILQMIRPAEFCSRWKYAFLYCAPKKNRWTGGWDFSGSSNLDALRKRLKGIMIRRLKRKVLKDLPKKIRTVIPVSIDNRHEYDKAEADFLSWLLQRKGKAAWDRASRAQAITRLNYLKQLAAEGKLNVAVQWIKDWLEETDQKLIVFGIHKKIMRRLKQEFPKALVIDGSVSSKLIRRQGKDGKIVETSKRQEVVDRFQKDPKARLLFGQLKAAGEGLDLVAASNVLFLELGWTPGAHDQAEDRVLRIGQKAKHVSIYYLVGKKTIELKILSIIQAKDETVGRILDGKKAGTMKLLHLFMRKAAA